MKFKKTPLFLPILLSLSLIFSSCNSVKTAGESSELTVDNSSVSSIKETENSNLSNSSVVSKVETESEILSTQSSEAPETNQQTPSSSAQQPEDLTSEGIERADRLMNELKNTGIEIIRFYSTEGTNLGRTGFQNFNDRAKNQQPVNVINGENNIQKFLESLKLKEWIPKRFNVRSLPKAIIYLSENLHINLETQQGGFSWMSINLAEYANVYFVVPNDVYDSVLGYIE
ncbi:MAG: hypothetical protein UHH95_00110, partial [Oscillospiraceae bacterium]|nr:hypothetical protein [Oscillospiraceae bacterium]